MDVPDQGAKQPERLAAGGIAVGGAHQQAGDVQAPGRDGPLGQPVEQIERIKGVRLRPGQAERIEPHDGLPHCPSRLGRRGVGAAVHVNDHRWAVVGEQVRDQAGLIQARLARGYCQQVSVPGGSDQFAFRADGTRARHCPPEEDCP